MGIYLNKDKKVFEYSINSDIYVDKTGLINVTNNLINKSNRYMCVTRPRRFGKSYAANMLIAYYTMNYDSYDLFKDFEIAKSDNFKKYLNKYNTIFINMQSFVTRENMIEAMNDSLVKELKENYEDIDFENYKDLYDILWKIYKETKDTFIFIIDEWDAPLRERKEEQLKIDYLNFYRTILKDEPYVSLVYMTGILPIARYDTQSSLNMFTEYSMLDMRKLDKYTGFTEDEVRNLCNKYDMDFDEVSSWYNGYIVGDYRIYNPRSVVEAIDSGKCMNYWTKTSTFDVLERYIDYNFYGLKEKILSLIGGNVVEVDTGLFYNDISRIKGIDDAFTLLIHLGYLGYINIDADHEKVFIPNREIKKEFIHAIKNKKEWQGVLDAINKSEELLKYTIDKNSYEVAKRIDEIHMNNTSIMNYNNENALASVISIGYYIAQNYYDMYREVPAGLGRADIVYIPRSGTDMPALIIELKWDKNEFEAMKQIKDKKYIEALKSYKGEILLVGINYNSKTKKHECIIESVIK